MADKTTDNPVVPTIDPCPRCGHSGVKASPHFVRTVWHGLVEVAEIVLCMKCKRLVRVQRMLDRNTVSMSELNVIFGKSNHSDEISKQELEDLRAPAVDEWTRE